MKVTGSLTALVFLFLTGIAIADSPRIVPIGLERSYVPVGFDDNDRVQITTAGRLPSSCYKVGPHQYNVDKATKSIAVEQSAYLYEGNCIQMVVPFTQTVDLGILEEGVYSLTDAHSGKVIGSLPVARAKTMAPDDFLYAPVTDAHIRTKDGKNFLFIHGSFTDRCMSLKEVMVSYQQDVIVVQPIAKYNNPNQDECGYYLTRYRTEVELKSGLTGEWLLHIRSMDGQAVNRFAQFP